MRFHISLALSASVGLVSCKSIGKEVNIDNYTSPTLRGHRSTKNQAFLVSSDFADNSFSRCSKLCDATVGCQSFSIRVETGGACKLYKRALYKDFVQKLDELDLFWDINCPRAVANMGPFLEPYTPTVEVPTLSTQTAETFAAYTSPSALTTDSPPYTPSAAQVSPSDDNEFVSTYTYEQFELPPVDATGTAPVTTGIAQPTDLPDAPCLVKVGSQAQFSVINENYVPMISRADNSIGPLLQPTAAPTAGDPILSPDTLELTGFYLEEPTNVLGFYDLVYAASTPQYVAMTNTGNIVLTSASIGVDFQNNLVTSIFKVDCFGRLSIEQGGSTYSWTTSGKSSKLVKESPAANNMKALPKVIPTVQKARKHRKRNQELAKKLKKRSYTDGPAPKCPVTPPNLVAKTKYGYVLGEGNFCDNMSDYWSLGPGDFDDACEIQSLCYDQCEDWGWQSCNAVFSTMMFLSCLNEFEDWWEVIQAVACAAQAAYFTGVAATSRGREIFYKAQGAMCRCFCSNPPDTCVFQSGDFYCADVFKGSDDDNCGDCGRQCGPNSKCRSGNCGCPLDQCGTTCLDFRNNPNNCGACGTTCTPAYCLDGRCYVPQPGECTPDQSVSNSDFYPSFTGWSMSAYSGCTLGTNILFAPAVYTDSSGGKNNCLFVEMTDLPAAGCQASVVQAEVNMCPGIKYEMTFAMGYVNAVGNSAVLSNADCTVRWVTGTPSTWNSNENYQYSSDYKIGVNANSYKTFGPWTLHVTKGEPGVRNFRGDLFVNLTGIINCQGPVDGAGRFALRDVKMTPVGSVRKVRGLTVGEELGREKEDEGEGEVEVLGNLTRSDALELQRYYPGLRPGEVIDIRFDPKAMNFSSKMDVGGAKLL
ncbi:Nn.00g090720.m01.CDS01 [Neocucurbitaria sp. VM-36]